jgi:predicted transcriptional regulator
MTENELLEELVKECIIAPLQDDEVTVQMLAPRLGLSEYNTRKILEDKIRSGEMTKRQARLSNGYVVHAYRKIDK